MKRRTSYIIPLISLFIFTAGYSQEKAVTLQLKWWHQFQFAGYYAAQLKGFYADNGLHVNIIPGDAKHDAVNEVLTGKADFGITGCDLLTEFANGKPLVALGAIFQHSPYVIITDSAKNIQTPFDLVDKPIMASKNQGWVELKAIFLKEGIDPENLQIVHHSWDNLDLVKGKAAAMTGYRSVEPFQLAQLGMVPSLIYPSTYGIDFYGDLLFTSVKFANQYPDIPEKFRRASFKGWDYAMKNKEEIIDYILTLAGVNERKVTREMLMQEAEEMEKLILPQLVEIGHMNAGRWEHIMEIQKDLGLIPQNTDLTGFMYTPKKGFSEITRDIGTVTLFSIIAIFIIILAYSIVVQRAVKLKTKEQRLALDALRSSEEKYRTLIEQASDGIVICYPNLQVEQVNSAALRMFGYDQENFYKLSLPDLLKTGKKEESFDFSALSEGTSSLSQHTGIRKDQTTFNLEINSTRLPNGDYMGFLRDVTEKKKAEMALKEKNKELNKLSAYLQNIREEERKKIAREVHDELGQLASAMKINIDWLGLRLENLSEAAKSRLAHANKTVAVMLTTIRSIASNLRPSILDDFGLHAALKWQCTEFINLNGIECTYTSGLDDTAVPKNIQTELFRIAQESLTNVMRHSKATMVIISTREDDTNLYLSIRDNGVGFQSPDRLNTLGLLGLKERAASLFGTLEIDSIPEGGTTITAVIPKSYLSDKQT